MLDHDKIMNMNILKTVTISSPNIILFFKWLQSCILDSYQNEFISKILVETIFSAKLEELVYRKAEYLALVVLTLA